MRDQSSSSRFLFVSSCFRLVVLFDTLLKKQSPEQIEAVLAHELGHWKNSDTLRLMAAAQVSAFVTMTATAALLFNEGPSHRH